MAFFQVQDKQMHYDLYAGVVPEDTLFIHGNLASNHWWQPTAQLLKAHYKNGHVGGSLLMSEWLGCGQSSAPQNESELDVSELAQDQIRLIKGLGLSDVNLVGHGFGAMIALSAVLQEPTLFRRAILLSPEAFDGKLAKRELDSVLEKMSQDRHYCDSVMSGLIHRCDVNQPLVQQLFDDAFHVDKQVWLGVPQAMKNLNIKKNLSDIKIPALVLHGEFDKAVPLTNAKMLAESLPKGEFNELKGHGHSPQIENPAKFTDLLCDFLY